MKFGLLLRNPAVLLLVSVVAGLTFANSHIGPALHLVLFDSAFKACLAQGCFAVTFDSLIQTFAVSSFFFLVGLELKRELAAGTLRPVRNAIAPLLAATFGVLAPALWYGVLNAGKLTFLGWPIPTATDVTFALAVYVTFGKRLPSAARIFLLAFAVIDDVIASAVVAFAYSGERLGQPFGFGWVLIPIAIYAFFMLVRVKGPVGVTVTVIQIVALAVGLQFCYLAGIEPALLAVASAFIVPFSRIHAMESKLTGTVSYLALPIFAFLAAYVVFPDPSSVDSNVFLGIVFRPIWKFVGVFIGGWIGFKFATENARLGNSDLARVAILGGIGFTVSLLVAHLAFDHSPVTGALPAAILATFVASLVSAIAGAVALARGHGAETANRT